LTTNSIRARPTPSAGRRHQRKAARIGDVQHDLGLGLGDVVEADILGRDLAMPS
jgi:hypothetical protein